MIERKRPDAVLLDQMISSGRKLKIDLNKFDEDDRKYI